MCVGFSLFVCFGGGLIFFVGFFGVFCVLGFVYLFVLVEILSFCGFFFLCWVFVCLFSGGGFKFLFGVFLWLFFF